MFRSILIVIIFSLLFISCSKKKEIEPLTKDQWEVFGYLPSETQFVMFMNLNELRKTEFWDNFFKISLKNNKSNDWLTEFENKTGVGINSGVSQIFSSSSWNGNNAVAITFDKNVEKVKGYFRNSKKFNLSQVEKKEIFTLKNNPSSKFYFVTNYILAIYSDFNYLNKVIRNKNTSIKENGKLLDVIKSISRKKHYWIATDEGSYAASLFEKFINSTGDIPAKDLMRSIKTLTLAAEFSKGVALESIWGCTDSKTAYLLSTAIKGALAMDLLSNGNPILSRTLNKIEVEREKTNINFLLDLGEEDLNQLKDLASKRNLNKKL